MNRRIIRLAPILSASPSIASDVGSRDCMPLLAGTLNGHRRKPRLREQKGIQKMPGRLSVAITATCRVGKAH
jgi:hypothetical protein